MRKNTLTQPRKLANLRVLTLFGIYGNGNHVICRTYAQETE